MKENSIVKIGLGTQNSSQAKTFPNKDKKNGDFAYSRTNRRRIGLTIFFQAKINDVEQDNPLFLFKWVNNNG